MSGCAAIGLLARIVGKEIDSLIILPRRQPEEIDAYYHLQNHFVGRLEEQLVKSMKDIEIQTAMIDACKPLLLVPENTANEMPLALTRECLYIICIPIALRNAAFFRTARPRSHL